MNKNLKLYLENTSDENLNINYKLNNGRIIIDFDHVEDDFLVLKYALIKSGILNEKQINDLISSSRLMNRLNIDKNLFFNHNSPIFLSPGSKIEMSFESKIEEV